jgi:hypothetical protein
MHPEIKTYYEKFHGKKANLNESGFCYEIKVDDGGGCGTYVIAMKYMALKILAQRNPNQISHLSHLQDDDWVYPFAGHLNDEAKMLRLLNLRAFL